MVILAFHIAVLASLEIMSNAGLRLSALIPMLLPLAVAEKSTKRFLLEWIPFYAIILMYDSFRGIADNLGKHVSYDWLIQADRLLFGGVIPTVWLQENFGSFLSGWPGKFLVLFYFGHFLLPIFICYWLWNTKHALFVKTMSSICAVSVMGFITFILLPAAPPWLASIHGHLSPVHHLLGLHLGELSEHLPQLYMQFNPNLIAAFPSLHAAYPMVLWLCLKKDYPRAQWLLLANIVLVAFMIVAFGEHCVIDVLAGWIYASVAYLAVARIFAKK
jgi:hypothetical protein